jgi:hypothetical protein
MKRSGFLVLLFLVQLLPLRAVENVRVSLDYYLPEGVNYDSAIPTPGEVLGFQPGEWHIRHDQLVRYLEVLADRSERLTMTEYARSHGNRSLHLLVAASPANLERLDRIREHQQWLANPDRQGEAPLTDAPLVIWMGYSIHGNEPSGSNAVPLLAYHLAAAQGEEIDRWLDSMVVLIDPVLNPDGLDKFASWVNSHRGIRNLVADPDSREHREVWPGSRANHYWFDLNRDWLPLVHPESRGRVEQFHLWRPQVLTDFHEMGASRTYFFQPGVPSRNNPLTPERNYALTAAIARENAGALNAIGSLYYTRESFDDFYVGKGSTYPDLHGSIGILFEQAGSRGHIHDSPHGVLTFPFTIRNQLVTSFGTLRAAVALRDELAEYPRWFYDGSAAVAGESEAKGFVFTRPADPAIEYEFLDLLRRHQIRVFALGRDLEVEGAAFAAGSAWVVPVAQAQARLVLSLFQTQTEFEESVFYDISTWVLPSAFNVEAVAIAAGEYSGGLLGEELGEFERPAGEWIGKRSDYAYLLSWDSFDSARALHRLLKADVLAKVATRPLSMMVDGQLTEFGRGTIMIPVGIQPEKAERIHEIVAEMVREDAVRIFGVETGLVEEGIDLGSPSFELIREPKVLLAVGDGVDRGSAGEVWHLFDQRVDLAVSLVETPLLNRIDLASYNVIVLADGTYSDISDAGVASLRRWVRQGGTLIALQRAARWAADKDLATADFVPTETPGKDAPRERRAYGDAASTELLKRISGAIVTAHVDSTHPIGFGFETERVQLFRQGTQFMNLSRNPYMTPVAYTSEPLYSGYISAENVARMADTAAVVISPAGSGRAVLMLDDPVFRGYWLGSTRLFLNSVFFGPAMKNVSVGGDGAEGSDG